MKEIEPKPLACTFKSPDCKGQVNPYALIENPKLRYFDLCQTHAFQFKEAIKPYEK